MGELIRRYFLLVGLGWLSGFGLWAEAPRETADHGQARDLGTVLMAEDRGAMATFSPQAETIERMVGFALTNFTHHTSLRDAWLSLVRTQDIVGIKVHSAPGATSGTRSSVVAGLIQGLISAGVPAQQIIVWDRRLADLKRAGFMDLVARFGVQVLGSAEAGYDGTQFYEAPLLGQLVWGDHEFGQRGEGVGRKSFVSTLVSTKMTKIIVVTPLLNHNQTGVMGAIASLALGSVDNLHRFDLDPPRLATAVPELYALPSVGDKVVLNVMDALLCQYQGEERSLLHYTVPLNQLWLSRDPLALDTLALNELDRQRHAAEAPSSRPILDIYQNAELLDLGISDVRRMKIERVTWGEVAGGRRTGEATDPVP